MTTAQPCLSALRQGAHDDGCAPSRPTMQASERGVLAGLGLLWGWAIGVVGTVALGARVTQALTQVTAHALLVALGASVIVVLLRSGEPGRC